MAGICDKSVIKYSIIEISSKIKIKNTNSMFNIENVAVKTLSNSQKGISSGLIVALEQLNLF
jgi:hypothetical protein